MATLSFDVMHTLVMALPSATETAATPSPPPSSPMSAPPTAVPSTPPPVPGPTAGAAMLSSDQAVFMVVIVGAVILAAGCVIIWARNVAGDRSSSFVRSWLAISLVLGLLLFTGFALALGDTNTRNLLVGALTASAGTAIAHYFSSKAAAEARKDMLAAATGTEIVPDLTGMSEDAAVKAVARSSFRFSVDPATPPANKTVGKQRPEPGVAAPRGSEVVATFQ